jgi:hypothetical protein
LALIFSLPPATVISVSAADNELGSYGNLIYSNSVPWANPFKDVRSSDLFYGDVEYTSMNGLFAGTGSDTFSPNTRMTRAMIVTVLFRLEIPSRGANTTDFTDVPLGEWYSDAVAWASENGIVAGIGNNLFAPNAPITRQDLTVIITRYAEHMGKQFPVTLQYETFADEADISDYAKSAVKTLYCGGIMSGKPGSVFDPKGEATRAEIASVIHRFSETVK